MQRSAAVELALQPFHARHAELVLSWVRSREEADRWASAGARELRPELLREWHADADVHPYLCVDGGEPVGYGEVWQDGEAAKPSWRASSWRPRRAAGASGAR